MIHNVESLLATALAKLQEQGVLPDDLDVSIDVERTKDPARGDVATNLAMKLARLSRRKPRELAELIVAGLPAAEMVSSTEIAGPGFINFFFDSSWLARQAEAIAAGDRAAVPPDPEPLRVVVDYSAPNVAKEMHVGHIRSTIIGDTIARTLEFLGHEVIRANHIGDWGTQFGMLIAHLEELAGTDGDAKHTELSDLETFYREAKQRYDSDPVFAEKARGYVVRLQGGDPWCLARWKTLVDVTLTHNQVCYDRLNVTLGRKDTMGESLYNDLLPVVVDDLVSKGLAVEDDGALVVFLDEYKGKDGEPMGVIIRKQDGGYLYTTTDIACARYRYETLGAQRIVYCVDSRQAQHLTQAWLIARKAGYLPDEVTTEHHTFGMMLGKDGKPFKTRQGGTVKLTDLLREAHDRAAVLLSTKNPDLDPDELEQIAEVVGIGAVKYADLSKNRHTDYVFDWDTMLSFDGNTAPYLQYAFTRIRSVLEKSDIESSALDGGIALEAPAECALARELIWFPTAVSTVASIGLPHVLCGFLYDAAREFTRFYEACPINKPDVPRATRISRLQLCIATARVLEVGLGLLGIKTLERM